MSPGHPLRSGSLGSYWAYLYLLRVPLLIWLVLIGLAPLSVWGAAPLGPVLRGLFDLVPPPAGGPDPGLVPLRIVVAFSLVALQALMAATAVAVTARLIVLDGAARFGAGAVPNSPGIRLSFRVVPALAALVLVAGAWSQSWDWQWNRVAAMAGGTAGGVLVFWFLSTYAQDFLWGRFQARRGSGRDDLGSRVAKGLVGGLQRAVALSPEGYLQQERLQDRHIHAVFQAFISLAVYGALFVVKLYPSQVPWVPTLCLTLTLLIVVCFALGAATFFFDRFRVPVLLVVIAYFTVVGLSSRADSFFRTSTPADLIWQATNTPSQQLTRLRAGGAAPERPQPVVLVAATGGGIQASAWTARVLAGLHQHTQEAAVRFDEAVSVVSAVSGGSVGTLFLLDLWGQAGPRRLPAVRDLDTFRAVQSAEASSLDDVAWGLVYSDLVYSLLPPARVGEKMLTSDRGSALEGAWRARMSRPAPLPLADWRRDAVSGHRPAVIFNATLVESGERLLISTTDFEWRPIPGQPWCGGTAPAPAGAGRRDFRTLYCKREIDAVTAARLSATFPYVSPATRILREEGPRRAEFHVVDGGYYDNYGVATLVEWINDAIQNTTSALPPMLVVEIRAKPVGGVSEPTGSRGLAFQALHPLTTMLQVWGTGQLSHNELDSRLVQADGRLRAQKVPFRRVIFEFPSVDADGVPIRPPLSWHLTPRDRASLRWAWEKTTAPCRDFVREFLQDPWRFAAEAEPLRCPR